MGPTGGRVTAAGVGTRWCGLVGIAGGVLLMLSYAALAVRQALDWQAGPTLGTSIHLPLMRTISTALLLLIVGVVGLLAARSNQLGWVAAVGGLLALSGFALWAYAAAGNFLPLPLPPWWHPVLFPALVALGSLVLGLSLVRSGAAPLGGALVGLCGPAAASGGTASRARVNFPNESGSRLMWLGTGAAQTGAEVPPGRCSRRRHGTIFRSQMEQTWATQTCESGQSAPQHRLRRRGSWTGGGGGSCRAGRC
jgi:hypothetical protein